MSYTIIAEKESSTKAALNPKGLQKRSCLRGVKKSKMGSVVYFIVVTYNGMKWIDRCLKSILQNEGRNIVVVDNASTDETTAFIKGAFPEVKLFELAQNAGFGAANNLGIRHALECGCDYVFLLNQDAYLEPGALSELLQSAIQQPDAGIVSPLHLNGAKNGFDGNFAYSLTVRTDNTYLNDLYFNRLQPLYEASFVNAAAWLLSKQCIDKVGLFDSLFFHYGEDENYCQRVQFHGFKVYINPNAVVLHDREDRNGKIRPEFHKDKYLRKKLIQLCNPFNDTERELRNFIKLQKLQVLHSVVTMNAKKLSEVRKLYRFVKKNKSLIVANTYRNKALPVKA